MRSGTTSAEKEKPALPASLPLLALVATAFLFVVNNSMVRVLDGAFTPFGQVFWRMVFAALFAFFLFRSHIKVNRVFKASRQKLLLLMFLGIVSGGVATVFRTFGFLNTTLINVQFIDLLAPAIVYIYSLALLRERFNVKLFGLTLLSVYGVLVVATDSLVPALSDYGRGEFFATCAVLTTSLGFIVRKVLTRSFNAAEISWSSFVFSAAFLLILILAMGDPFISHYRPLIFVLLIINSLLTCIGIFLLNWALGYVSPTLGSQVNQLKIIFTLVIGFLFFNELPTLVGLGGGTLVISAIYGLHLLGNHRKTG